MDNTQLPADWLIPDDKVAFMKEAIEKLKASNWSDYKSGEFDWFNHKQEGRYSAFEEVLQWINPATAYATKLLLCDKANSALEERNRGLTEQNADNANKLNQAQQEKDKIILDFESYKEETSGTRTANIEMIKLLKKIAFRHEGGLLPDDYPHIPNLDWLVPMAINKLQFPSEFAESDALRAKADKMIEKDLYDELWRVAFRGFRRIYARWQNPEGVRAIVDEVEAQMRAMVQPTPSNEPPYLVQSALEQQAGENKLTPEQIADRKEAVELHRNPGSIARETIEDILLKTGKHNQEECTEIADAILNDLKPARYDGPITTVFVPCMEGDPQAVGSYTSNDGRSLCHVRESNVPVVNGAVWSKGAPKVRKLYYARFIGHLSDDIHDGIIEPVSNQEYWQAIASGVRISIKADHIVEHLDESGKEVDDWISIDDQLPQEGGRYWCYVQHLTDLGMSYFQWNCDYNPQLRRFSDMTLTRGEQVTHWRTIPAPPKQKEVPHG